MSQKQAATPGVRINAYQRAPVQKKVEGETKLAAAAPYVSAFSRAPAKTQVEGQTKVAAAPYVSAFSRAPAKTQVEKPLEKPGYGNTPALQSHIENLRESSPVAYKAIESKPNATKETNPAAKAAAAKPAAKPAANLKKKNAFAIIHFGKNPVYLELELYFFKMLRQYTNNDILYLYSLNDTPKSFVDAV